MTLVADSGSTKTVWVEVESGCTVTTQGLNPHFSTDDDFAEAMREVLSTIRYPLTTIHFYGAGCGSDVQRERVGRLLAKGFGTSDVHVWTDMLGACRATAGHGAAVVGILGTGSNACLYDGRDITMQPVSTGYVLGDHGSANHVGRLLLQGYLGGTMPGELRAMFCNAYPMGTEQFIDAVYHQPRANRFLASLAPFAVEHIGDGYCAEIVGRCLEEWYDNQLGLVLEAADGVRTLHMVGGFGAAIAGPLRTMAEVHGIELRSVVANPIEGLRIYHGAEINTF